MLQKKTTKIMILSKHFDIWFDWNEKKNENK